MDRSRIVQVASVVVVGVFAVGIWWSGDTVNPSWLRFFSLAVAAAMLVLGIWDHWLWRLAWIQKIPGVPRDMSHTWKGVLTSFWEDPVTHLRPQAKTVFLVVRQSASKVTLVLLTEESWSRSSIATVDEDDAAASVSYMYFNRPDSRVEHRSRMHNGAAFLQTAGRPVERIRGRYWTDRDSRGELEFTARRVAFAEDFSQAVQLFETERAT
jgi:SMODS-associating 2TM, beta-strand rich effector domain